jgi:hypothetical protein
MEKWGRRASFSSFAARRKAARRVSTYRLTVAGALPAFEAALLKLANVVRGQP